MFNLTETLFHTRKPWDSPAAVATGEIDVVFDCHPRKVCAHLAVVARANCQCGGCPPADGKSSHNTTGREARPGDELADEIG